jgi:hypothetical protein
MHLCEMFFGVRPSVYLFRLYHMLCSTGHDAGQISGFYFQHRVRDPVLYIVAVSPGKWDRWRQEWVVMHGEVYDRLVLLTTILSNHSLWEEVPDLQPEYHPMERGIQFLEEKGLTSMMVFHAFMLKCIALL